MRNLTNDLTIFREWRGAASWERVPHWATMFDSLIQLKEAATVIDAVIILPYLCVTDKHAVLQNIKVRMNPLQMRKAGAIVQNCQVCLRKKVKQ